MKIGDRIYVRGYVDEIRKDTVIVRNDGGYFGTIPSEVITGELPSAQPDTDEWCHDCKEYDKDHHCCPRWNRVIKTTLVDAQEWIPCSERLPDICEHHVSEPCIVYCSNGAYGFAELEENIFGQVGWNCERDDEYHEPLGDVLAWMPLPGPYKGEQE